MTLFSLSICSFAGYYFYSINCIDMDISKLLNDIDEKYQKVQERINTIKNNYNEKVYNVNEDIDELEVLVNKAYEDTKKGIRGATQWVQGKMDTTITNINTSCEAVTATINDKLDTVKSNYDDQMFNLKKKTLKSIYAKVGTTLDDDTATSLIESLPIPHPSIDSLLPEIKIEFPTPDVEAMINEAMDNGKERIELPKFPYL